MCSDRIQLWRRRSRQERVRIVHLWKTEKAKLTILENVSGVIKPGRMTLLLGPPGSGKTALLKALAGRLASDLRVSGTVTLNGHLYSEFVPQRTAAYISQRDLHVGEMTEITRREKEAGIYPEADVNALMKMTAIDRVWKAFYNNTQPFDRVP